MIEDDVHRQMDNFLAGMQNQGISADMYYQLTGTSADDLHKQFEEGAEKRVKTNLVLEAIVKAEKDRKSTRLNSSHVSISYAVFCLKKKTRPLHHIASV